MVNSVILMGRLTRDPELRHTASNTPVTSFTLAVDRGGKKTEGQQTADFIDIVAWEAKADFAAKYFRKGQLVAVCGRLQTRKWTDNNASNRTAYEVIATELHFAEPKNATQQEKPIPTPQRVAQPISAADPIDMLPVNFNVRDDFEPLSDDGDTLPF